MKNIITLICAIFSLTTINAQTPFDSFDSTMANTPIHKAQNSKKFIIPINDNLVSYLKFNVEEKTIGYYNLKDSLIGSVILADNKIKWLSIDPLAKDYPGISPYTYVANNPINSIDPDGRKILFVNGYYNTGDGSMPSYIAQNGIGTVGGQGYWGGSFIGGAKTFFKDNKTDFIDGRGSWNSTGEERFNAGYEYAKANLTTITADMVKGETVKIVSHSMGSAYAEGVIKYLQEQKISVEKVVHLSAADPSGFKASSAPTLQLNLENDIVLGYKNFGENNMIGGVSKFGEVNTERGYLDNLLYSHADTKFEKNTWSMVSDLQNIQMQQTGNSMQTPLGSSTGISNTYNATGNSNGTQFNFLNIGGNEFNSNGSNNQYQGPLR